MHTPVNKLTPEFQQLHENIMDGTEILDTPQKLKKFWLIAIEEGWKNPTAREQVALLTEQANWKSPLVNQFNKATEPLPSWYHTSIWLIHNDFTIFKAMRSSPNPSQPYEVFLDEAWKSIEDDVKEFQPKIYEEILKRGTGQDNA